MSELKTLKDIELYQADPIDDEGIKWMGDRTSQLIKDILRQEAIKWYKQACITSHNNIEDSIGWCKFFNIAEEDLK